jgi:hypothetical protein
MLGSTTLMSLSDVEVLASLTRADDARALGADVSACRTRYVPNLERLPPNCAAVGAQPPTTRTKAVARNGAQMTADTTNPPAAATNPAIATAAANAITITRGVENPSRRPRVDRRPKRTVVGSVVVGGPMCRRTDWNLVRWQALRRDS